MPTVSPVQHKNWPMDRPDFAEVAGTSQLACTQQTHCGMHVSIFSHTRMTMQAGSLVYVRVGSGRYSFGRGYMRTYQSFPAVLKWLRAS